MQGLMQDWPLLCHRIIDHAASQHADRAVVTRSIEGPIHQTNYAEIRKRALKVAQRLDKDSSNSVLSDYEIERAGATTTRQDHQSCQ